MLTITEYMPGPRGTNRSFHVRGCTVLVSPSASDEDSIAAEVTRQLASAAEEIEVRHFELEARLAAAEERARRAEALVFRLESRVPPQEPARLMGPGCVRFDATGKLWLLNQRAKGWSSWGVICDGWDDLFRRYDVAVTARGTDEHGAWWEVTPTARAKETP